MLSIISTDIVDIALHLVKDIAKFGNTVCCLTTYLNLTVNFSILQHIRFIIILIKTIRISINF